MENSSMFKEVQAHTIECLNQIVIANHNRQQEIKSWLKEAIHNGKMEYAMAIVENVSLEKLSTVAKYCMQSESIEEVEKKIMGEASRMSGVCEPILITSDIAFIQEDEAQNIGSEEVIDSNENDITNTTEPVATQKKKTIRRIPVILDKFTVDGCEFTLSAKRPTVAQQRKLDAEMQR